MKQVHYESGPNMTPLVDVVMVILIFLMLAGSFGTGEKYMQSQTAVLPDGAVSPVKITDNLPVIVDAYINVEGAVKLPNAATATTDVEAVSRSLASTLKQVTTQTSRPASDVQLVLRPDAGVEWDKLAPVYDAALRANFEKISFAAAK